MKGLAEGPMARGKGMEEGEVKGGWGHGNSANNKNKAKKNKMLMLKKKKSVRIFCSVFLTKLPSYCWVGNI